MESSRQRGGFIKSKLTPFYRSAKPSTATTSVQYNTKVKSSASQSSPSTASVGFVVQNHHHHQQQQDYMIAPSKPKVSLLVPDSSTVGRDKLGFSKLDKLYGVAADESVDMKAASYISSVQERFRLERTHSERITQPEDMQQT